MLAKCVPHIPGTSFRVNVFGMIKATQEREVNMLFDAPEAHQKESIVYGQVSEIGRHQPLAWVAFEFDILFLFFAGKKM